MKRRSPVVALMGGLGNQLFQVAAAVWLKERLQAPVLLAPVNAKRARTKHAERSLVDPQAFDLGWSNHGHLLNRSFRFRLTGSIDLTEEAWALPTAITAPSGQLIRGYFQTSELLSTIEQGVIPALRRRLDEKIDDKFVGVHIRLNDYLKPEVADFHGVTDPVWSLEQGLLLREALNIPKIVVFSDSPILASRYCESLKAKDVEFDVSRGGWEVLNKMTASTALVMANSSLSWWAGCLISSRDEAAKVVIPKPWLRNESELDRKLRLGFWKQEPRRIYDHRPR